MKKLLGILVIATTMIASTFALDFSVGGRGLIGGNIDDVKNVATTKGEGLVYGGGAFVNLGLLGGLGAQAEVNFVSNQVGSNANINLVDIPVMLWYNFDFFRIFTIGFGAGPNFSMVTNNVFQDIQHLDTWNVGIGVGANFKIYFNKHFGLVLGANGVFDFTKRSNEEIVNDAVDGKEVQFFNTERKAIYGTLGAEFKLF